MSGGITIVFVDVAVFLSQFESVRCASVGSSWCETDAVTPACADKSVGLYRRTLFKMIIEQIDLVLSRLKQGFDSPRERQPYSCCSDFPLVFGVFPKPTEVVWAILFALCPSSLITASSARPACWAHARISNATWPASKKTTKQLMNRNFVVSKNRDYY